MDEGVDVRVWVQVGVQVDVDVRVGVRVGVREGVWEESGGMREGGGRVVSETVVAGTRERMGMGTGWVGQQARQVEVMVGVGLRGEVGTLVTRV